MTSIDAIVTSAGSGGEAERRRAMLADVRDGLSRRPRELPPKYFYDERGSRLFEEITRLPEYYLTRAEREILLARAAQIVQLTHARTLVELGAGSAAKTRILLAAMHAHAETVTYVPIDVSEEFLEQTRNALEDELPWLRVEPVVADMNVAIELPPVVETPVLFAFLGSTIGNFDTPSAVALLRRIADHMLPDDRLLLGTDLRKDPRVLDAAYNDSAGVTAEFNRNMLRVLNAELGADFVPDCFAHRAFYDECEHRIEMHLHALGTQTVHIPGLEPISFADGEAIRTELSYKYDQAAVAALADAAGLSVSHWFVDAQSRFALSILELAPVILGSEATKELPSRHIVTDISPARFAAVRDEIHETCFSPQPNAIGRVGAEVEFLVLDELTHFPLSLLGKRGLIERLRRYSARSDWSEFRGYDGTPRFDVNGTTISFEPGGQLEISTTPCNSASELVRLLHRIVNPMRSALAEEGVELLPVGIDPYNDVRRIPLQLHVDRYERMTRYFDEIGPFGVRMMRQTAAIQLSLDRGPRPAERWRLLNDLAPYLIAMFANSPHYTAAETGYRSFRANCWRMLDATRTGVAAPDDDPASEYARFALAANDMLATDADGAHRPFSASMGREESGARWATHLTTLFPEVRPRGHFEVRSCDAIDPAHYAAPIVLLTGLAYDERSAKEATLLAAESRALLRTAGEAGLRDVSIARTARDLFALAIAGARRLGPRFVDEADLDVAAQFYGEYTARGRSPADDRTLPAPAASLSAAVRSQD
jgi:dimethylhistidine N-methyltransferase/glutamate--cysteine ligase